MCEKQTENIIKDSSIDCFKKSEPSNYGNVITANNMNLKSNILNENSGTKNKYKKIYNDNKHTSIKQSSNTYNKIKPVLSSSNSNNGNISNKTQDDDKYLHNINKIQYFFREYLKRKNEKIKKIEDENEKEKEKEKIKEDTLSLTLNKENTDTFLSSNSLNNSKISQEKINNGSNDIINKEEINILIPFNLRTKIKTKYKYSGYLKKNLIKTKNNNNNNHNNSIKNDSSDSFNTFEKNEINDNEEKHGHIKEGFGKFIFNDGTEFCGIFHDNFLQKYGKYSNINHKNKNGQERNDKEIIITDNLNYEEFIGEYKDYMSDGFGIYRNYITNLKITGIFNNNGISGIGIEDSVEGGYVYTGEFKNNKKDGYGTIEWKDGNKYQGEFKDNQLNGYGMIEFPGQKYYQGEVKNGRMDGFGEFFWNNDKKYIGNYKNDKRNGLGVFIFKANNMKNSILLGETENNTDFNSLSAYIGFWKNGNMDGFGMKVNNYEVKYGLWENGSKRKYLESNFALKTYIKWIEKRYNKLFERSHVDILKFLEICSYIDNEINPINQKIS